MQIILTDAVMKSLLTLNTSITDHPKVECKDTAAELDETMVTLKCRVRANPPIENARYVFKDGEETIKVGERVDSIYMRKEDGVEFFQMNRRFDKLCISFVGTKITVLSRRPISCKTAVWFQTNSVKIIAGYHSAKT